MSNTFRTVALAAALIAASAGASAGIVGTNPDSPVTNGAELQLIVSSATAQLSFQMDLGITMFQAVNGANYTFALPATFLSSALATANDATWAVVGFDMYGDIVPDADGDNKSIITTIRAASSFSAANPGVNGDQIDGVTAGWLQWIQQVNRRGTNPTSTDGYSLTPKTDAGAYWLDDTLNPTNNLGGRFQMGVANPVGVSANLYRLSPADIFDQSVPAVVQQIGGQGYANFDGSTLVLGAVPEPETYALLLAGLLAVGHMVRRQRRA